jgi:hypothetical protein
MGTTNRQTPDIIDVYPFTTPDGEEEWVTAGEETSARVEPPATSLTVRSGIVRGENDPMPLTTVPNERLAGGPDWNRIIDALSEGERGAAVDVPKIGVKPGGEMVILDQRQSQQPLSTVPRERLAAGRATRADLAEARREDPHDAECWRFIDDPNIPGLRFTMTGTGHRFDFFCVRSPAHGGRWLLTVLQPNLDDLIGHDHHMVTASIGGETTPIVCGPGGRFNYASLSDIRGVAAKFALYHTVRPSGHVPFSA